MNAQDVMIALRGKCVINFQNAKLIAEQAAEAGIERIDDETADELAFIISNEWIEKAPKTQAIRFWSFLFFAIVVSYFVVR